MKATTAALAFFAAIFCQIECRHASSSLGAPSASRKQPEASAPVVTPFRTPEFTPLEGNWIEQLDAGKGPVAVVTPPLGSTAPRPVIVAVHGGGDRPEWACGGWRLASHAFAFVVCPAGTPLGNGNYAWASPRAIADAIDVSLAALRRRYGDRVSAAPLVYAGFSQGATLATDAVFARQKYQAGIFAEGGYDRVTRVDFATSLRERGVRAAMLVCGSPGCFARVRPAAGTMQRAGLSTFTVGDPLAGHNLNQRMQDALQQAWPRFVAGLTGWDSYR